MLDIGLYVVARLENCFVSIDEIHYEFDSNSNDTQIVGCLVFYVHWIFKNEFTTFVSQTSKTFLTV